MGNPSDADEYRLQRPEIYRPVCFPGIQEGHALLGG